MVAAPALDPGVAIHERGDAFARAMGRYAGLCGAALASAHARSGDRIQLAAYLGRSDRFDRAIVRFAESYADQVERDYAALVRAAKSGRIPVERPPSTRDV